MEYKLPDLPKPEGYGFAPMVPMLGLSREFNYHTPEQVRQYAEQAVAPLLAEIERLEYLLFERGEADSLE